MVVLESGKERERSKVNLILVTLILAGMFCLLVLVFPQPVAMHSADCNMVSVAIL